MKPNRVLVLSTLLVLLAPTLWVAPVGALDRVGEAPQQKDAVYFKDVETNLGLYLRDIASNAAPQTDSLNGLSPEQPPSSRDVPAPSSPTNPSAPPKALTDPRPRQQTFAVAPGPVDTGGAEETFAAIFTFDPNTGGANGTGLRHDVKIRGAESTVATIFVQAPPGLRYTVELYDVRGGELVASGATTEDNAGISRLDTRAITVTLRLAGGKTDYTFAAGEKPTLRITASQPQLSGNLPIDAGTWTLLYDERDHGSRVDIVATNALKTAAWTQSRVSAAAAEPQVLSLFRNLSGRPDIAQLVQQNKFLHTVDGYWIVKSAFGLADVRHLAPSASILDRTATPIKIDPWNPYNSACDNQANVESIPLRAISANEDRGTRLFRFQRQGDPGAPSCLWRDYWQFNHTVDAKPAGGEFTLNVKANYRPSQATSKELENGWRFVISNINVQLTPFSVSGATELSSHPLLKGSTTTFLMRLRNGGAANDTIKVTVGLVAQSRDGFSADPVIPVLGDVVQTGANTFKLGPGNATVLAITIRAPNEAGHSATYQVTAESQTDPTAESARQTVVLTAGPTFESAATAPPIQESLHQPRLITRADLLPPTATEAEKEERVPPGEQRAFSVYVWNRYVLPQTVLVNLSRQENAGWSASLLVNGRGVTTAPLTDIPAGGLSGINLQASVLRGAQSPTEELTLTADLVGPGSVDEFEKKIVLRSLIVELFELRILGESPAARHIVEAADPAGGGGFDHLDGAYYRVWITNNANSAKTFQVSASITEDPVPTQAEQGTPVFTPLLVGVRDFRGDFKDDNSVTITAGKTAEMYVWIGHVADINARPGLNDADVTIRVRDTATGGETKSRQVRMEVVDGRLGTGARHQNVIIEPVVREDIYSQETPFVDISKLQTTNTQGTIRIGDMTVHRMRVVNGASWWMFEDPLPQNAGLFYDSRLNITVSGVDTDKGWNTYFRLARETDADFGLRAPLPAACTATRPDGTQAEHGDLTNPANGWVKAGTNLAYPPLSRDANGAINANDPINEAFTNNRREGFWDGELEVLVCAPPSNFPLKPLAGQFDQILVTAQQIGPRSLQAVATREITSVIQGVPDVKIEARVDDGEIATHVNPRGEVVVPIFIANNGSYLTNVTLEAKFPSAGSNGWEYRSTSLVNITPLRAFENRTLAFRFRPPATTSTTSVDVTFEARWLDNLYDPTSAPRSTSTQVHLVGTVSPQTMTIGFGAANAPCAGTAIELTCTAQLPANAGDPMPSISVPLQIANQGSNVNVQITVPTMPGWVFTPGDKFSYNPQAVLVGAGSPSSPTIVQAPFIVRPPREAVQGSYVDLVITAREREANGALRDDHISQRVVRIVMQGGISDLQMDVNQALRFVERNQTVAFQVAVRNNGNVDGDFRLVSRITDVARAAGTVDPRLCDFRVQTNCWSAVIEDVNAADDCIDKNTAADLYVLFLRKNQLCYVNVTVNAPKWPFIEQENARATALLTAHNLSTPIEEITRRTLTAEIQDYGVEVTPEASSLTIVPGLGGSLLVLVKNTGDANDTLNLSLDMTGLPWRAQFSSSEVFLTKGSTTGVRLTIQTPIDPLPAPRTAKFWVFLGTRGGQAANVSVYDYEPLFVTIPDYRQLDVDGDNITELAVDVDRDKSNGYEVFQEYSSLVRVSRLVDKALGKDKHFKMLLDRPVGTNTYDGVADRFWDPDANLVTDVKQTFDLDKDQTPDYLLDTDGDDVVDSTFQAATRQFLKTDRVKLLGNDAGFQFLIDTNGDGKPDRYYDPVKSVITKLTAAKDIGPNVYGVDTDDDGRVDLYYDYAAKTVTPATGVKIVDFARDYWWVFAGFVGILVLFGVVLMRRRAA